MQTEFGNEIYRMLELSGMVNSLSEENGLKLIYQWVKTLHISFDEFKELLTYVNIGVDEDLDLLG